MLSDEQKIRYSRHTILDEVGPDGQGRLLAGRVLVVGVGGLGSPVLMYLAAAGIGTIGIADSDKVDLSNLQRQIIHSAADPGRLKTHSARDTICSLNPEVRVIVHDQYVDEASICDLIAGYDFVVDCTDNFSSKFIINDACVRASKPFSHAGVLRFQGQLMTYLPGHACYRCLFKGPPQEDIARRYSSDGILGAVPGIIGSLQAAEALKFIAGIGHNLVDKIFIFDVLEMRTRIVDVAIASDCPVCGKYFKNILQSN